MRRTALTCLTLAAALVALPALALERPGPRAEQEQLEALIADLEALIGRLDGTPAPIVRKMDDGLISMTFPLSADDLQRFRGPGVRKSKNFKAMDTGHSQTRFKNPNKAVTHPFGKVNKAYTFWSCFLNLNPSDLIKTLKWKLTGPGMKFNINQPGTVFQASAVVCFAFKHEKLMEGGVYTNKASAATAGANKEIFVAF